MNIGFVDLQCRSGRFEQEINLLSFPGIEPRFLALPVTTPAELSRLINGKMCR